MGPGGGGFCSEPWRFSLAPRPLAISRAAVHTRRMRKGISSAWLALAFVVVVGPARADVAPPPSDCLTQTDRSVYADCDECNTAALDGGTCADVYAGTDYALVCSGYDASYASVELWCRSEVDGSTSPDTGVAGDDDGGCSIAASSRRAWPGLLALGLGLLAALRLRGRR